jgi:branched-chain amino acid transport system permease protein
VLFGGHAYLTQVVIWIALNIALAASLRFMLLAGEVNLAVGAFFGIGAYTAAILALKLACPGLLSIIAGGGAAALASIPFGYLTLRLSGHYFMLISFALTEISRLIYTQSEWLGGNSGLVGIVPGLPGFPVIVLLISAAIFLLLALLERSHFGRLLGAIAQNEAMVRAVGVSAARIKLLCLVISSFTAGVAGSTLAYANTVIAPGDFGFLLPVTALACVKIGGQAHPAGAVIGTVILSILSQLLIGYGAQDMLLYGAAIVLTMLFMPSGITGLIFRTERSAAPPAARFAFALKRQTP